MLPFKFQDPKIHVKEYSVGIGDIFIADAPLTLRMSGLKRIGLIVSDNTYRLRGESIRVFQIWWSEPERGNPEEREEGSIMDNIRSSKWKHFSIKKAL